MPKQRTRTIASLAKSLGVAERAVRSGLDGLRRQGYTVKRVAPCTFQLHPPKNPVGRPKKLAASKAS